MWNRQFDAAFEETIPAHLRTLVLGKAHWTRSPRYRELDDAVDPRSFTLVDGWHAPTEA